MFSRGQAELRGDNLGHGSLLRSLSLSVVSTCLRSVGSRIRTLWAQPGERVTMPGASPARRVLRAEPGRGPGQELRAVSVSSSCRGASQRRAGPSLCVFGVAERGVGKASSSSCKNKEETEEERRGGGGEEGKGGGKKTQKTKTKTSPKHSADRSTSRLHEVHFKNRF